MEKKTTVDEVKKNFEEAVKKVKDDFDLLGDNWKGHSYNELKKKVDSLVAEAAKIAYELNNFANICDYYKDYKKAYDDYMVAQSDLANIEAQLKQEGLSSDEISSLQVNKTDKEGKMRDCKVEMLRLGNLAATADANSIIESINDAQGTTAV